ncbi:MAG TPA: hypothetical protein DCM62_04700 [Bacteroidales bacterium]|nr:hypothetical protein [Bacteroidales bacterium]
MIKYIFRFSILLTAILLLGNKSMGNNANPIEEPNSSLRQIRIMPSYGILFLRADNGREVENQGIRIFGEYHRRFFGRWHYGIGLDGMIPISGNIQPLLKNLSFTVYYRLPVIGDRLFFVQGLGVGANFLFREGASMKISPSLNVNLLAQWRVTHNLYLEFSPMLILPTRHSLPMPNSKNQAFPLAYPSIGLTFDL